MCRNLWYKNEPENPSRHYTMFWPMLLFAYRSTNQIQCFDKYPDPKPLQLYMEMV